MAMTAEAHALGQALVDHHRKMTSAHPPGRRVVASNYTIRYGILCQQAGVPHVLRIVGRFLGEVGGWCADNGYPPLNSLAVNDTGLPGDGYEGAGGFTIVNWPIDVEACIRFAGYPQKMP
jgi:hypothetical protein